MSPPARPGAAERDFFVLTGFLGSGKTTLLREYLLSPDAADTAVVVNEVGEVGLDGAILREGTAGQVATAMLSNGCICCAMGSDLAVTVDALLHAERPGRGPLRRIVLETSGIAKPGPVLRQLASLAPLRLRVRVVGTYDAEHGPAMAASAEAAAQWAGADALVVTKADRVSPARFAAAAAEAGRINPLARVIAHATRRDAALEAFGDPAPAPMPGAASPLRLARLLPGQPGPEHGALAVLTLRSSRIPGYGALAAWLDNLAGLAGDRLLRLKGLVRVAESAAPLLVQSVGTVFSAPRPMRAAAEGSLEDSVLVLIGRGLAADEVASVQPCLSWRISAPSAAGALVAEPAA